MKDKRHIKRFNEASEKSNVRERLIEYLNGRIQLIQSKYQSDECDERIIDEIVDIRTDIQNNSF